MSDASSNPNLEISEGESSLKSPLLETMQNEVQLPAEKVEMPPKRAPAGPEDHFKVGTVRLFFPFMRFSLGYVQGRIQDFWKGRFICIKAWQFALLVLSQFSFFLNTS